VCDCCDGSDELINGRSPCPNTCEKKAEKFRGEAEKRLEVVKRGFESRQATLAGEIAAYFSGEAESETTAAKELAGLQLLKERVVVHKDREELKERKYRLEVARHKQADGHDGETSKQQFSDAAEKEAVEALQFEGLDALRVADDEAPVNSVEDERASEVLDSTRQTVKSLVELLDGTRIPLADYLRMDHNKHPATKKLRALGLCWSTAISSLTDRCVCLSTGGSLVLQRKCGAKISSARYSTAGPKDGRRSGCMLCGPSVRRAASRRTTAFAALTMAYLSRCRRLATPRSGGDPAVLAEDAVGLAVDA
jgi:hypothetical protein